MRDETIVYDVAWSALQPQLLHASLQPVHSISTPTTGSSGSAGSRRPDARQLRQELTAQPAYQCIDWSARNLIAFATCSRVLPLATTLQSVAGTGAGASLPTGSAGVAGGPPASMNTVTAGPSSAANQANPNPTQSTSSAAGTAPSVQEASGEMRLHTIHIMDPNTPWAMCSLAQEHHTRPIKTLKWSGSGFQLISIDDGGTLCLWRMRSHLANEWYCEHTQSYGTDESVVAAVWLENGLVHKPPTVVDDMSDASLARSYSEKFSHSFSTVPLGAPSTSWLLLTSSGKLFLTSRINSSSFHTSILRLLPDSNTVVTAGDIAVGENGRLVVATCGTPTDSTLSICEVVLDYRSALPLVCTQRSRFSLRIADSETSLSLASARDSLRHIKFDPRSFGSALILTESSGAEDQSSVVISRWEVNDTPRPVHAVFSRHMQTSATSLPSPAPDWQCRKRLQWTGAYVTSLTIGANLSVVAATADGEAHFFDCSNLAKRPSKSLQSSESSKRPLDEHIATHITKRQRTEDGVEASDTQQLFSAENGMSEEESPASQNTKTLPTGPIPLCIVASPAGCAIASLNSLESVRILADPSSFCLTTPALTHQLLRLQFEFCIFSGRESWDVLLCLRYLLRDPTYGPDIVDRLYESILQGLQALPSTQKQLYLLRGFAVLIAITKCVPARAVWALNCEGRLMLEFVCDAFRSSLVPPADSARWPSEALAVALNASDTLQSIDNLLSQLRFNDYELPATILTALLPFVDWITPFVICIFKNLMHVARSRAATELVQSQDSGSSASNTTPFLSFLFQSDAAQLLRETLVYASLLKHQASISTSKVIQQHNNVQQQQQQHSQPQYEQQQQQIYDSAASLGALNHGVARESSATIKKLFNILSEISFKAARDASFSWGDISNLISALEVLQKPEYEQTRLMRSLQLSSTSRGVLGQLAHVVHGPALRVLARDAPDTAITAATPVACPAFLFGKATKSLVPGIFNSTAEVVPGREVDGVNSPHGGRGVASPPAEVPGSVLLSDVMEGDAFDDDTTDARFTVRSRRSVSLAALNSVQKTTGSTVTEPPHARRDVLKQTFVSGTVDFRECMRCGRVAVIQHPPRMGSSKWVGAHKWIVTCLCGGLWRRSTD